MVLLSTRVDFIRDYIEFHIINILKILIKYIKFIDTKISGTSNFTM